MKTPPASTGRSTPTKSSKRGIFRLTERFPALTEAEYADEMLALFRRAGLELSRKDLHMLLALRQESDRMLLRQKRPSNDAQARPHTQR